MAGVRVETACKEKQCDKLTGEFDTKNRTLDYGHQDAFFLNSGNKCEKKCHPALGHGGPGDRYIADCGLIDGGVTEASGTVARKSKSVMM